MDYHRRHLCFQKSLYDRSEGLEALSKGLDWELDRCGLRETMDDQVYFSCRVNPRPDV